MGCTQQSFIRGGSALRPPFYIPFFFRFFFKKTYPLFAFHEGRGRGATGVLPCTSSRCIILYFTATRFASTRFNSFQNQCSYDSQSRILALHVSRKTRQSRFTEQFFNGSRFMKCEKSGSRGHENPLAPIFHMKGIEWSLRAFASTRALRLFLRARAVIKFVLRAPSTLETTTGEQRPLHKFSANFTRRFVRVRLAPSPCCDYFTSPKKSSKF